MRALVLLIAATTAGSAQTPDTTAAARYYPLAVGNEWHTAGTATQTGQPDVTTAVRLRVESAEPGAAGSFLVRTTTVRRVGSSTPTETTTDAVWRYDAATRRVTAGAQTVPAWCPFDEPFGGTSCAEVIGGYGQAAVVATDTVLTTVKTFRRVYSSGSGYNSTAYTYAAGIGPTQYAMYAVAVEQQTQWNTVEQLVYARVGSVEVGEPLFAVAGEGAPGVAALRLTVGPNPTGASATLRFTLAAPGHVRLTLADALGREAAVLIDGTRGAGGHAVPVETARLAAGVYVVRLAADRAVATRRLTVVR